MKKEVLCCLYDQMTEEFTVMQHFKTIEQAIYSFKKGMEKIDQQIWPYLKLIHVGDVEQKDGVFKLTAVNKQIPLDLKKDDVAKTATT